MGWNIYWCKHKRWVLTLWITSLVAMAALMSLIMLGLHKIWITPTKLYANLAIVAAPIESSLPPPPSPCQLRPTRFRLKVKRDGVRVISWNGCSITLAISNITNLEITGILIAGGLTVLTRTEWTPADKHSIGICLLNNRCWTITTNVAGQNG